MVWNTLSWMRKNLTPLAPTTPTHTHTHSHIYTHSHKLSAIPPWDFGLCLFIVLCNKNKVIPICNTSFGFLHIHKLRSWTFGYKKCLENINIKIQKILHRYWWKGVKPQENTQKTFLLSIGMIGTCVHACAHTLLAAGGSSEGRVLPPTAAGIEN